jgi:hypothetical protein
MSPKRPDTPRIRRLRSALYDSFVVELREPTVWVPMLCHGTQLCVRHLEPRRQLAIGAQPHI